MDKLAFFTQRMELQRVSVKIAGAFKKSCLKTGKMDYSLLEDLDFQEEHPFSNLIKGHISKTIVNDSIYLRIHVGKACFKKLTNMVTGYELHAIMLFGDPAKEK
jgi:hypothetical protein